MKTHYVACDTKGCPRTTLDNPFMFSVGLVTNNPDTPVKYQDFCLACAIKYAQAQVSRMTAPKGPSANQAIDGAKRAAAETREINIGDVVAKTIRSDGSASKAVAQTYNINRQPRLLDRTLDALKLGTGDLDAIVKRIYFDKNPRIFEDTLASRSQLTNYKRPILEKLKILEDNGYAKNHLGTWSYTGKEEKAVG